MELSDWYNGGWIQMYMSGKRFFPLDPRASDVHIEDIAHNLSMICRFVGNCREFYSVAQHCCLVSDWMEHHRLEGLMHDAAEAYIGDQSKPVKHSGMMKGYRHIEDDLEMVIAAVFKLDVSPSVSKYVKEYDNRALFTEKRFLLRNDGELCQEPVNPLPVTRLFGWSPAYAEEQFLKRYRELTK